MKEFFDIQKVFTEGQVVVVNNPGRKDIDGHIGVVCCLYTSKYSGIHIYDILVTNEINGSYCLSISDIYLEPANEEQEALYRLAVLGW